MSELNSVFDPDSPATTRLGAHHAPFTCTGATLGWLLETLSRSGPDHGARRNLRLFIGTGILGGYTTYGSFAVETDGLIASDQFASSILYGLVTVIIGAAASLGGIALGSAIHRHRKAPRRHREWRFILGTGFLGGYATFSTARFETVRLAQNGRFGPAFTNGFGMRAASLLAARAGLWAGS